MAIAAAAGLSRAAAETTTTTTWKCARKRNQYTTDGRMDAGAEAGSDRLSCDVRRHCQRRHDLYTCLSIYLSVVSTTPSPELWPPDISMPPRNQTTRTSAPPLGLRLSTRSPVAFSEGETKFCGTQIFSVF